MTLHHMTPNPTLKWAEIDCTASGSTTVIAAVASKQLRIRAIVFTVGSSAVAIQFLSNANVIIDAMYFDAYGGMEVDRLAHSQGRFMDTNAGEAFALSLSGTNTVRGQVCYEEI